MREAVECLVENLAASPPDGPVTLDLERRPAARFLRTATGDVLGELSGDA